MKEFLYAKDYEMENKINLTSCNSNLTEKEKRIISLGDYIYSIKSHKIGSELNYMQLLNRRNQIMKQNGFEIDDDCNVFIKNGCAFMKNIKNNFNSILSVKTKFNNSNKENGLYEIVFGEPAPEIDKKGQLIDNSNSIGVYCRNYYSVLSDQRSM